VIVPLELDDLVASGAGARQSQGRLHRLAASVGEDDLLDAGQHLRQQLGESNLVLVLGAEGVAARELSRDARVDGGVVGADDQRPPGERVVEQPLAVDVEEVGAVGTFVVQRHRRGMAPDSAGDARCQTAAGAFV
jgi:hypothetical protein